MGTSRVKSFVFFSNFQVFNLGLGQTSNLSRVEFINNRLDKDST